MTKTFKLYVLLEVTLLEDLECEIPDLRGFLDLKENESVRPICVIPQPYAVKQLLTLPTSIATTKIREEFK